MAKKTPASFQPEKQQKKNKPHTFKIEELTAEYNALLKKADKDIDLADIPELNFEKLGKPIIGKFYHPLKKPISIRMDADVLEWFKSHSHYQTLINKACRLYMNINTQRSKRKSTRATKKKS